MLKFTTGNMFDIDANILINTVNCVGVMGCGVALAFKNKYPKMFREYKRLCKFGQIQPGVLWNYRTPDDKLIVNFPTKDHWRKSSKYSYVQDGLRELRSLLLSMVAEMSIITTDQLIAVIPALGCGHGGLDWNIVKEMIAKHLGSIEGINIYVFQPHDSTQMRDK